jgi:predicted dehydrogenase
MPIEIALLGCGHPHVADVLGVVAAEPDLRLAAAWDSDRSAIPGVISAHAVDDLDRAIRRADAVVVCAPTDQRGAICTRAARAGRPVLVEKPVALDAAEARRVAREIARSRTPAYATLFLRQLPALARLRGVLRSDLLGRVSSVTMSLTHAGALNGMFTGPASWMRDPRRSGVGGFGDLAIHLIDALAVLGPSPRLDAVMPDRDRAAATDLGGTAIGRWAGAPVTVRASWATSPGGLRITVSAAAATAVLQDGSLDILGRDGSRERWVGAPPDAGEALRGFAERLRTRRMDLAGLEPAIRAQEIIERATVLD